MATVNGYTITDAIGQYETGKLSETLQRALGVADVILRFDELGKEIELIKNNGAKDVLGDFDTELALVFIENMPDKEQPDHQFLLQFHELHKSAHRHYHRSAIHIYKSMEDFKRA